MPRRTVAFEEPELAVHLRALDRQEAELRRDAAPRGEAADLAAGRDHAMARHDDRKRVLSERLPHVAGGAGHAEPSRDADVRRRRARSNRARDLVDAALKRWNTIH